MGWLIWAGILPICLVAAGCILQRPLRLLLEDLHVDSARESFRQQREMLEARFVTALSRVDPAEGRKWDDAHWHDEVLWARDRQSRHFLALVCVHFDGNPFEQSPSGRHATAVFEYRKDRWYAEGRRLDEIRPDEAVGRNRRFEPVTVIHPNPRRGI
jgi:hypothetical protein